MIEHANLHHHQLHDGQLEPSSPTSYGGGAGTTQQNGFTQNFNLNINKFNPNCDRGVLNQGLKNNDPGIIPGFNSSMVQHVSPHNWHTDSIGGHFTSQLSSHEDLLNLARIKQELSETNFPKFTDMLSTSSPSCIGDSHDPCYMKGNYELARPMLSTSSPSSTGDSHDPCYMKDNQQRDISDPTDKLLLKTITSPGFPYHRFIHGGGDVAVFSSATRDCSSSEMGGFPGRSGRFSQIFPSINVSNLNQTHSALSGPPRSFDMNSEALDLLNTTRFGGTFGQDSLGPYSGLHSSLGLDQMQSSPRSSSSPSQILSPFSNEITLEPKRSRSSCSLPESNKATEVATKKMRVEPRASCPPLKVRKEKLGDRVAALQQLVAPFGKTDTASVLMEAIGYINFLQNQVETLSVPYMKSSRNKSNRSTHMGSANVGTDDENEEMKRDLRSRGLCLVPLSCMSYVTNTDGGNVDGGVWPRPNFGGDT